MTNNKKFEIACKLEENGISENEIREVRNALYTNDTELLQSSLSIYVCVFEEMEIFNQSDLKVIERYLENF